MRRLTAIFPFPRRLRGWLHLEGIPGTELDPTVEPGEPTDPGDPGDPPPGIDLEILSHDVLLDIYSIEITFVETIDKPETNYVDVLVHTTDGEEPETRKWQLLDKNANVVREWQDSPFFEDVFRNQELIAEVKDDWDKYDAQEFISNPFLGNQEIGYSGEPIEVNVLSNGWYELECFGAQGGGNNSNHEGHGGKGGHAKGKIYLNSGDTLYVYVGGEGGYGGDYNNQTVPGGWNGGGDGGGTTSAHGISGSSGGGATDIRLNGNGLENRIIVAGAGAGGVGSGSINARRDGASGGGGGYYGGGGGGNYAGNNVAGQGGTQEAGGSGWTGSNGELGIGGDGEFASSTFSSSSTSLFPGGVGGGLSGGDGTYSIRGSSGGGGSSFITMLEEGETTAGVHEGNGFASIKQISTDMVENTTAITSVNTYEENEEFFAEVIVETIFPDGLEFQLEDDQGNVLVEWQASNVFGSLVDGNEYVVRVRDVVGNEDSQQFVAEKFELYQVFEATSTGRGGTIQSFTVPESDNYRITAFGAQGGAGSTPGRGGYGSKISGIFALTEGDVIDILVGQKGVDHPTNPGGGGGTFVVKQVSEPDVSDIYVVAGGGGAFTNSSSNINNSVADADIDGDGKNGFGTYDTPGQGGSNGQGGTSSSSGANSPGGGAGFFGDATGTSYGTNAQSYINGGIGGTSLHGDGGYGGGGQGGNSGGFGTAGAGGGYSGGGGGWSGNTDLEGAGGGGGSLNNGTEQDNEAGENEGNGKVIIETI